MATRLEKFAAEVHDVLNDASVQQEVFQISVPKHAQRRRVCWVPTGGPLAPPKRSGGTHLPTTPGAADGIRRRDCALRQETVEVHVYAESRETVEVLFENLLAAIADIQQDIDWGRYVWPTEEAQNAGLLVRGSKIIFTFTLPFPVSEELAELTIVSAQEHTCEFDAET